MSIAVHIDWPGDTWFVGRLYPAERGAPVSFEYAPAWLSRPGAFSIDPTALPLQRAPLHAPALFGSNRYVL